MLTNLNVDKRPRWWSTSVNVIAHLLHRRRKDVWELFHFSDKEYFKISEWQATILFRYC